MTRLIRKIDERPIFDMLQKMFRETPAVPITENDRLVIFSDLHLGNGCRKDDFLKNSELFKSVLQDYYLKNNYQLVLNGDIEELQRYSLKKIQSKWREIYELFARFQQNRGFYKILGNHDHDLYFMRNGVRPEQFFKALKFTYHDNSIFVFHGHQASYFMENFNSICGFVLRYIAKPMGIKNFSYSYDSKIRFRTEKRVYNFSRNHKIVSLIGHTHRPLFESFSKIDCLKYNIEHLCREYPEASPSEKEKMVAKIELYTTELQACLERNSTDIMQSSLYNTDLLVPCIFNSGSVINKSGLTAIEICNGNIALVFWFDRNRNHKYFQFNGYQPVQLDDSDYFRVVLKEDSLDYIFTRIQLLA